MDYSTIAYWEVPVALFVGLVVFGEPVTLNTAIGIILIVGGGAFPTVKAMIQGSKMEKQQQVAENLSERLAEEAAKEEERLHPPALDVGAFERRLRHEGYESLNAHRNEG